MANAQRPQIEDRSKARTGLSTNPERAVQEVIQTIEHLRGIYVSETKALKEHDTNTFLDLQDRKFSTAQRYEQGIHEIISRKNEMKAINPSLKQRLATMQAEFSDLARENMEALTRMQRTMDRLSGTIREAARDAVNKERTYSYSESGALHNNDKRVVSTGISETA